MKEYLMSIAMYCLKYAEEFGFNEDAVSDALGYVFRVYQEDVKYYSNQELSLLVALLSREDKNDYKKYIDLFTKERIEYIINNSKTPKDSLKIADKLIELNKNKKGKITKGDLVKIVKELK